mmetsp:Transcript_59240/g.136727  ORF Transcript_59240/g.136727 Transcript_59240/m.136727 type:complete len:147 (-) Transcript_59240:117-557(-)
MHGQVGERAASEMGTPTKQPPSLDMSSTNSELLRPRLSSPALTTLEALEARRAALEVAGSRNVYCVELEGEVLSTKQAGQALRQWATREGVLDIWKVVGERRALCTVAVLGHAALDDLYEDLAALLECDFPGWKATPLRPYPGLGQ